MKRASSIRSLGLLMPRWGIGLWLTAVSLLAGLPAAAAPIGFGSPTAAGGPIVQLIDADVRDDRTTIFLQFACSVRLLSSMPVSHGSSTRITLRLGTDCGALGNIASELPQVGGGADLNIAARLDSSMPGEVTLELSWSRELDFVMAPTADAKGLRVRLLDLQKSRKSGGAVLEATTVPTYSVNLDAGRQPFGQDAIEAAANAFATQAYESQIDVDGEHWYRLRLGPYAAHSEAERVLGAAQGRYPRAWIAINDDDGDLAPITHAGTLPAAVEITDPPLPDEQRATILSQARLDLGSHHYAQAVDALTRLVRQPEYPARADALELLGLARERAGQLALAKAEYQAYLQRYPNTAGAERVRQRLQALVAASIAPRSFVANDAVAGGWSAVGSASLGYQYGRGQTVSAGTATTTAEANAALLYGDLLVRDRGARYDFVGRADAGYTHNSVTTDGGSQDRTTAAYAELTDRSWGLTGRIGRQSLASQGTVGLFDGLAIDYRINPYFSVSAAGGYPAYTSYSGFSLQQQFESIGAEFAPSASLVFDLYLFNESEDGFTDRRSLGFQSRYSRPGHTAIVLVDYDIYFQQLNSATLLGNFRIGEQWVFGFNLDHRHSPLLETNNALIGQSAMDLRALEFSLAPLTLKQLALDRTAQSDTAALSLSRPIGERWQLMVDLAALRLGSTPASGGVAATSSTGLEKNAGLQLAASSLCFASDLHIFGIRVDDSSASRDTTLTWDARFPVGGAWRLGPRLSVARLDDPQLGGRQTLYLPEARADWVSRRQIVEMVAGYQLQQQSSQQLQTQTDTTVGSAVEQRNLYVSATYRIRF